MVDTYTSNMIRKTKKMMICMTNCFFNAWLSNGSVKVFVEKQDSLLKELYGSARVRNTVSTYNFRSLFLCNSFVSLICSRTSTFSEYPQISSTLNQNKTNVKPDIKTKYEKYFFGDFLSADFWQKL